MRARVPPRRAPVADAPLDGAAFAPVRVDVYTCRRCQDGMPRQGLVIGASGCRDGGSRMTISTRAPGGRRDESSLCADSAPAMWPRAARAGVDRTRAVFDRYHIVSPGDLQHAARRRAGTCPGTSGQDRVDGRRCKPVSFHARTISSVGRAPASHAWGRAHGPSVSGELTGGFSLVRLAGVSQNGGQPSPSRAQSWAQFRPSWGRPKRGIWHLASARDFEQADEESATTRSSRAAGACCPDRCATATDPGGDAGLAPRTSARGSSRAPRAGRIACRSSRTWSGVTTACASRAPMAPTSSW